MFACLTKRESVINVYWSRRVICQGGRRRGGGGGGEGESDCNFYLQMALPCSSKVLVTP